MLELLAAGAALAGRALLQAADTALLAVGEDELRALEREHPHRVRWLLKLKKEQFNLRFRKATNQVENTAEVRKVRRNIARVMTRQRQTAAGAK